jgi:hypothetical protein
MKNVAQVTSIVIDSNLTSNFIVDLNDTILAANGVFGCSTRYYQLDLDGNDSTDFTFTAICYMNGMGALNSIKIEAADDAWFSVDTNVVDTVGVYDSTGTAIYAPAVFSMVRIYNYQDVVITANCNKQATTNISNRYVSFYPSLCVSNSLDNWISGEHYMGIKKKINGVDYSGWIKAEVLDYYNIVLKEFALNTNLSGLKKEAFDELMIFPNPADERLNLQGKNWSNSRLVLFDIFGNKLKECFLREEENFLDLQSLSPGIYLLRIEKNGVVFHRKFVKN